MVKIIFIVSHLYPQGPNRQLLYLCSNLDKSIITPIIVTTSQNNFQGSLHENFLDKGIEIYNLKLSKLNSIFKANKDIQKIIDSQNIDIILSYGFRSDLISHNLKRVIKLTSVRNTLIKNWKITRGPVFGSILGNINLHFIRKFDYVIACSTSVSNYLKTLNLKSETIRNSIDVKAIRKNGFTPKSNPNNTKSFITISSKLKGKNIEFLLMSFTKPELSKYNLFIAGYVDLKVQQEFENYSNIHFLGHISNLNEYLFSCDFFISSSLHEGMPNAVLEALALGTPVILSDIPPHKEILNQQDEIIGVIFKNNSFESLNKNLNHLLSLEYKNLSEKCTEAMLNSFSVVKMAEEYSNLFLSIKNQNYPKQIKCSKIKPY